MKKKKLITGAEAVERHRVKSEKEGKRRLRFDRWVNAAQHDEIMNALKKTLEKYQ